MRLLPFLLFPALCLTCPAQSPAPPEARYKVEVLATGMPQPMELELAADGRIFFIEIAGKQVWIFGSYAFHHIAHNTLASGKAFADLRDKELKALVA